MGEKLIDGYRQLSVNVSVMEELKKIQVEKGYPSYNKVIRYLVGYWKESYKLGEVKEK